MLSFRGAQRLSFRAQQLSSRAQRAGTRFSGCCTLLILATAQAARGQSIASRIDAVRDGRVVLSYETRPDVCGFENEDDSFNMGGSYTVCGRWNGRVNRDCVHGPAYVTFIRSGGRTSTIHVRIGRPPVPDAATVNLGSVDPDDAVVYLVNAARTLNDDSRDRALAGAAIANSDRAGPQFLALAEEGERTDLELRKHALFWAGQSSVSLDEIVAAYPRLGESDLREHYAFVLSQRREPEATDDLIALVRNDHDSDVRRKAIFWLGQRKDPKARQYLADLILR
jgi:hypothetical protein